MGSGIQLEMNFENNCNRLKNRLNSGKFSVLFEVNSPSKQVDFELSAERLREMEFAASSVKKIYSALAVTDKYQSIDTFNVGEFVSTLSEGEHDKHLVYISGRNTTLDEQLETLHLCKNAGFCNIVPVTGCHINGENAKQTSQRPFTESVSTIYNLEKYFKQYFYSGCVVNPFKYTPADLFTQYFKLVKKLHFGAEFFVTQFGWDMLKLQELRWYLSSRGMHIPAMVRIMMLSPDKFESIMNGKYPGVHLSPDFRIILQNELKYSFAQFEAAQWRRLQIQAAGCKLLGYNGIQIAGIDRPDKLKIAALRIAEALEEFKYFDDWKRAYYEHLARAEMAPYPHRFYLFNQLFSRAHLEGTPHMNESSLPQSTCWEKFYYKLCEFMFRHAAKQAPDEHLMTKRLLTGCRLCQRCRLPQSYYICPETCPKGLANGPCGGTKADGKCETGNFECIHSKKLRLALWRNEVDKLEEYYIKTGSPEPKIRKDN